MSLFLTYGHCSEETNRLTFPVMDLELRHLRIVREVADAGSVSKAASRLGLAQPALTAQLKRIERVLGGTLFERDRHGARPTRLGELVLARARVLLPAAKELQEEAVRFAHTPSPGFRIGATNGPILGGLVDRIAAERAVTTYTSWSAQELNGMVEHGRLDYVLTGACGDAGVPSGALLWETISLDPVFVLVSRDHSMAGAKEVGLADLAGEQWAVTPGDGCFADCFATACARAGFTPGTIYETDVPTCTHLARVGRAVVLCQATHQPAAGLVMVPLAGAPLRWRQLLGRHPTAPDPACVVTQARQAHHDAVRRSPVYADWLDRNPGYGTTA
ncbi:DNA-binding transcriptional regulator, LysR family [Nonomuraea pusilla]|uniref:DNA-binding transcriptional regulator, LysR family n=2 Tax=Nonomuraea pusilla TaxID=46177 RepID=A0A1H7MUF0_9ACTN|nr:DNA-binding transcriptional regulator, LysR family [Nonomuraea pusilla]